MTKLLNPYAVIEFRGRPLDAATAAACVLQERVLGYRLTLLQGIGGNPSSAGTHTAGRGVDLAPYDAERKERAGRDVGFAAWERDELPGEWGPHVHEMLILFTRENQRGISSTGFNQISYYDRGLDGLASMRKDPHPYRPSPQRMLSTEQYESVVSVKGWDDADPVPTLVTKARDKMVEADADLGNAIAMLKKLAHKDYGADIRWMQKERVQIRDRLDTMSKR
jgi:hypothetical protein